MPNIAVLIPMKTPCRAKSRLSGLFSVSQRVALVKNMLRRVLLAARGSSAQSVTVVGGGVNVRRIASKYFAEWTASLGNDLNADLMDSIKARESEGFSTIYLPGDLPFVQPIDIDTVIDASRQGTRLVLVPSSSDGGTSCMLIPSRYGFTTLLGHDSFNRHLKAARDMELESTVITPLGVSMDLDTEEDLIRCEELEPGFRARLGAPIIEMGESDA